MADPAGAAAAGIPVSTYRLQLTPGFGFAAAAEQADYLAALGVTHVYLSPILQANPGSRHGYDVVDHSRVSADLGGEDAFRSMVEVFHRYGLGVIVDVVPNHMARPTPESLNKQLWSVLAEGKRSPYAHWFDVDWAAQDDKLLMPILAGPLEKCLPDLVIDTALRSPDGDGHRGPVLRYFDHVLPLRDGVADLPLGVLLAQQHYLLADWHDAATELNWRRFFDIDTLIAIRAEDPDVFDATHQVLLRLYHEGLIDGLRVDHPDGLADPAGYLQRLSEATGGAWVVVEKILAHSRGAARLALRRYHGLRRAGPGRRAVRGPGRSRPPHRGIRQVHRREAALRRGGADCQARHRGRHVLRRAGQAHPVVRPRRLPGAGRLHRG